MPTYRPEDINQQTILSKEGDPSFLPEVCATLHEAVIEVNNRWSKADQEKAQFKIGGRKYTWADIRPHVVP